MKKSCEIRIDSCGNRRIFAIEMSRMALATALPRFGTEYLAGLERRQVDWLNCLIGAGDGKYTYDLRFVSHPLTNECPEGRLRIALLCSIDSSSMALAVAHALEVLRLCRTFFEDEYEFEPIIDQADLEYFRVPFNFGDAVRLNRRAEIARLDSLVNSTRRNIGFKSDLKNLSRSDNRIFHVYPFIKNSSGVEQLFKLLVWQDISLAISVRLFPTRLTDDEGHQLATEIGRCEQFLSSPHAEGVDTATNSLRSQSEVFKTCLIRSLGILKENAAMVSIEIVGEKSVPQTVVDVFGASLTVSPGSSGFADSSANFLSGGFEFERVSSNGLSAIQGSWRDLVFENNSLVKVPEAASRRLYLFDSSEATSAFRFPTPTVEEIAGVVTKAFRTQLAPPGVDVGQLVGHSSHKGRSKPVNLSRSARRRHVYAVGQTGTGKSTMFESMIREDVENGEGVCVIDPHGDLIDKVLLKIPKSRANDVVLFDPGDTARPIGFNILEYENEAQKHFIIQELLAIVERMVREIDPSMIGPVFFQHSRNVLQLVMSDIENPGTLVQFYNVFSSKDYYKRFLPLPSSANLLQTFVDETLAKTNYTSVSNEGTSMGGYISSKYEQFIGDPMLRNIFGQQRSTINLREIMDDGKILLVNLSKGRMGELSSRFFGMVLIAKLQAAAMSRAAKKKENRRDFYLYVDEFQNLATQNFSVLLAEARKYRLNLILTNQFVSQVSPQIMNAIAGNVGSLIAFRVGSIDAEFLERDFVPYFNRFDLMNLPNFHTYVSTLVDGEVSKPFSMRIISDLSGGNEATAERVRSLSRMKYGVPVDLVEKEIEESLQPQRRFDWIPANDPKYREQLSEAFLRIPVDYLEVSTRLLKSLQKSDFKLARDIASVSELEFRQRTGLSNARVQEMRDMLLKHFTDFAISESQES